MLDPTVTKQFDNRKSTLLLRPHCLTTLLIVLSLFVSYDTWAEELPEIRIISSVEEMILLYQQADYWGELEPDKILEVPPILVVATVKQWRQEAAAMTVQNKKELFYRSLLPLVLYSNAAIAVERQGLLGIAKTDHGYVDPDLKEAAWLLRLAIRYRIIKAVTGKQPVLPEGEKLAELFNELLLRVDTVPASLALGQGAYESGYGTSRFALEGNSFFGQWTYDGKGMSPKEKRGNKGNYGVAAYDWPLDSVRSYMMNLNTHRAYTGLRRKRAELREQGKAVNGQVLAQTLLSYSERGLEYVESLQGMMRFNQLDAADDARLSQGPVLLIVNAKDEQDALVVTAEISALRANGELTELIAGMGIADL
jgi:Bax protein